MKNLLLFLLLFITLIYSCSDSEKICADYVIISGVVSKNLCDSEDIECINNIIENSGCDFDDAGCIQDALRDYTSTTPITTSHFTSITLGTTSHSTTITTSYSFYYIKCTEWVCNTIPDVNSKTGMIYEWKYNSPEPPCLEDQNVFCTSRKVSYRNNDCIESICSDWFCAEILWDWNLKETEPSCSEDERECKSYSRDNCNKRFDNS